MTPNKPGPVDPHEAALDAMAKSAGIARPNDVIEALDLLLEELYRTHPVRAQVQRMAAICVVIYARDNISQPQEIQRFATAMKMAGQLLEDPSFDQGLSSTDGFAEFMQEVESVEGTWTPKVVEGGLSLLTAGETPDLASERRRRLDAIVGDLDEPQLAPIREDTDPEVPLTTPKKRSRKKAPRLSKLDKAQAEAMRAFPLPDPPRHHGMPRGERIPDEYRLECLKAVSFGHSPKTVAPAYGILATTLEKWIARYVEWGADRRFAEVIDESMEPRRVGSRKKKAAERRRKRYQRYGYARHEAPGTGDPERLNYLDAAG